MKTFSYALMITALVAGFNLFASSHGIAETRLSLDGDKNGLYSDTERKALMDLWQTIDSGIKGIYDHNHDGKVTILEQTQGHEPLTKRLNQSLVLASTTKVPWGIDIFPEWISSAYLIEDASPGAIAELKPRGTIQRQATQSDPALQPRVNTQARGIVFAANSGQHLTMVGVKDSRWDYRWCTFLFRIDASTGSGDTTVLVDVNHGNAPNHSSPKIWYTKGLGLHIQYVGRQSNGLDKRLIRAANIVADGTTWNMVVCGTRHGRMYTNVNGKTFETTKAQPDRFAGDRPTKNGVSYIGGKTKDNMTWALNSLVFGLTEPSEAMVLKLSGWGAHRGGSTHLLPATHPYKYQRPVVDEEDFPYRYIHNNDTWLAWGAQLKDRTVTRLNAGGERQVPQGFERVFYDDFRADRIEASMSSDGSLWMAPGFNTAVGASATLNRPDDTPNVYPYDAKRKQQTFSLAKKGKHWRASAAYTVNDMGHGYTWSGPKVFRIRCKFPEISQKDIAGGLFPAFWSYDPDYLFWRTANRIEVDWFEFDGKNGWWFNGLSSHYHYSHFRKNIFAKNPDSYKRFKMYSGELKEEKSKIKGGMRVWDGQFHTWEFVVDRDKTFVNITIPNEHGTDTWVEICRGPTSPTYLERLNLQIDYALKAKSGTPKDDQRQDFIIDFVEVLQKSDQLGTYHQPFTALPILHGGEKVGDTITCQPNTTGISDIRYYWFVDGYPITYGTKASYTVRADDQGKAVRCMVKAVGARSMPEAWSAPVVIK